MLQKVLWCLLALLAALVGIYGVVRLGWTWELFVVAGSVAFCLVAAVLTPEKSVEQELEEAYESVGPEEAVPASAAPLVERITRRFTWDEVSQACEADGPTGF